METINIQKERLVLTRIYRTISQKKPWSHTQPERQCSAEAQQPLFCSAGCGDAFRHVTPVLVSHGVQRVSMVQKWQKQQTELQKILRPFLSSPSIKPSPLKDTGNTNTQCAQWQQRDCVVPHSGVEWPYLNTFQLHQKRGQCSSPRTPGSVGALWTVSLWPLRTDIVFHRGLPSVRAHCHITPHKSRKD